MTDGRLAAVLAGCTPFAIPLATTFRGIAHREGMLLTGPSGTGEFAPFLEYDDATAARWLASAIEAAWGQWPAAVRSEIPVNAIIPALNPVQAATMTTRAFIDSGSTTVKVKVAEAGQTLDDDLARVAAVRSAQRAAGIADARIRIDVNGGWNLAQAVTAIAELDNVAGGLEYVEQPCATLTELAALRKKVSTPIAADESIRTAEDPMRAVASGAADIIVVKVPPLGGVNRALEICEQAAVPVVVSGAMDSSVGLASGLALASALRELPYACGLGTGALLAADVVATPVVAREGRLSVRRIEPDPAALAEAAVRMGSAQAAWWRKRLERAWNAGANDLVGSLVTA
ncbi:MAG: o-succinylbenzoate synthase [Actinobacteria bacterium]|nr:o-succinylbenzoate synthase [Actinomycetota bacterium]